VLERTENSDLKDTGLNSGRVLSREGGEEKGGERGGELMGNKASFAESMWFQTLVYNQGNPG